VRVFRLCGCYLRFLTHRVCTDCNIRTEESISGPLCVHGCQLCQWLPGEWLAICLQPRRLCLESGGSNVRPELLSRSAVTTASSMGTTTFAP